MRQRFESQPANQRFRSLWINATSSKGLFVQALTYQFLLPAIANTPPAIASSPPAPQNIDADIYTAPSESPSATAPIELTPTPQPGETISNESAPSLASPAATLVPQDALTHTYVYPTAAELALAPIDAGRVPKPLATVAKSLPKSIISTEELEILEEVKVSEEVKQFTKIDLSEVDPSEIENLTASIPEEPEFSWFSLGDLTQKGEQNKAADSAHQLAFTTRIEPSLNSNPNNLPILIAGPQDLNPGLSSPPQPLPSLIPNNPSFPPSDELPTEPVPISPSTFEQPTVKAAERPFIEWSDLEIGISSDFNNFGESSWSILPSLNGQLANGNTVSLSTGFSQFDQTDFETVTHTPLTLSWQGKAGGVAIEASGGINLFDRLSADTHADAAATFPLGKKANLSLSVAQGPYLINAQTLENQISRWQYGPDLYWEMSPKTRLFSTLRLGNYSDGNFEQQSFSRIERQIGETATVALNLINQSFQQSAEETSGYFSPRDFLVATAEMSWQEKITEGFSCGALGSVGQQRLAGEWALAYSGRALCTIDIAAALQVDLGYQFSNVSSDQSALLEDSAFSNQQVIGSIRVRF